MLNLRPNGWRAALWMILVQRFDQEEEEEEDVSDSAALIRIFILKRPSESDIVLGT